MSYKEKEKEKEKNVLNLCNQHTGEKKIDRFTRENVCINQVINESKF
jgi:hypothetical protein